MTNTEAIETLRANYPDACFEQLREAVDAAIVALKAQNTSGDTISRQAAIDSLEEPCKVPGTWADEFAIGERTQWEKDVKALNSLPSAERHGKWDNGFCSMCGEEALTEWNDTGGEYAFTKFCPNCGAKMDIVKGE